MSLLGRATAKCCWLRHLGWPKGRCSVRRMGRLPVQQSETQKAAMTAPMTARHSGCLRVTDWGLMLGQAKAICSALRMARPSVRQSGHPSEHLLERRSERRSGSLSGHPLEHLLECRSDSLSEHLLERQSEHPSENLLERRSERQSSLSKRLYQNWARFL